MHEGPLLDLSGGNDGSEKAFLLPTIASAKSRSEELFQVVQSQVQAGSRKDVREVLVACCNQFAILFANKINCIWVDLDSGLAPQNLDAPGSLSSLLLWDLSSFVLWDEFPLVSTEDVDWIVGRIRSTMFILDSCPSRLIKEA